MKGERNSAYLSGPQVQARYGICDVTLYRWQNDPRMNFPKPMVINRRKFFREDEIAAWERERVKGAA